jgi:hypothetical protein
MYTSRRGGLIFCASVLATAAGAQGELIGPDLTLGGLTGINRYPATTPYHIDGIVAYAMGETACNLGDQTLAWQANNNQHPVWASNMYRLKDGRFEQIGMSWLKHEWCAVDGNICATCQTGTNCNVLGIGCSSPSSASISADQTILGPRSEVNPVTGEFPYPYVLHFEQTGDAIFKRLQVRVEDVDPAQNPGALYFGEGHYIHPEDAAAGNGNNNASWRRFTMGSNFSASFISSVRQMEPALFAWREFDPEVRLEKVDIPGDGRLWIGARATDNGDGTWHYEYAIQNLNSLRAVGLVSVPIEPGTRVSNVGFHDVDYHSGEPYDNTDWNAAVMADMVEWSSPQMFAQNKNSNALRWGTLYNYRFDANAPPTEGTLTLGLFTPGAPGSVTATSVTPSVPLCVCDGDIDGSGTVDGDDIPPFVAMYLGLLSVDACADVASPSGGPLDEADLGAFVDLLLSGAVCP